MRTRASRRHVLFVLALVGPCLLLVSLGVILIDQGRELAASRLADERVRLLRDVQGALGAQLERVKLAEASARMAGDDASTMAPARDARVALVGWIRDGLLVLPWDVDPAATEFGRALRTGPFARLVALGEKQEATEPLSAALGSYVQAKAAGRRALERDYADLLRARALTRAGRIAEANAIDRELLASTTVDEFGVPLALYAASRWIESGRPADPVLGLIDRELESRPWTAPSAAYRERDLLTTLTGSASDSRVTNGARSRLAALERRIEELEQALTLQRDFKTLAITSAAWTPFGRPVWLVSETTGLGKQPPLAVAVRAAPVFAALEAPGGLGKPFPGDLRFNVRGNAGEPLGEEFPGLRLTFTPAADDATTKSWRAQRSFYAIALATIVSATLIGGYFLWRDMQRDLRVADLRSQFVSSVSHELKTPLTAIRMFAETLLMRRADPQVEAEYLGTIVNESERLTRLLNGVLDLSNIDKGQKTYRLDAAPVVGVLYKAVRAMEYPLAQQGFTLRVDASGGEVMARIDRDAIEQVILNLVTNAMKYSAGHKEIDLKLGTDGRHAVIEVSDHGLGIAPSEQTRIFERFYRARVPENQSIPGAGLGLALVDHIVKAHGGFVKVTSALGRGSTFAVHLPLETVT